MNATHARLLLLQPLQVLGGRRGSETVMCNVPQQAAAAQLTTVPTTLLMPHLTAEVLQHMESVSSMLAGLPQLVNPWVKQ